MFMRVVLSGAMLLVAISAVAGEPSMEFVGASSTDLDNPHDLKLSPDGRQLFVSDTGNNRVVILDPETLQRLGEFGTDHQSGTHDVDFDLSGRVYVADTHKARVNVYEMKGLVATLVDELKGPLEGPEGVLVHPNGHIYVAGAGSGNVVAFVDGKPVKELKGLSAPHDLENTANGDIWLSDSGNDRLLLLSPDLDIKRELKGSPYNFNGVRYMDVMADGTLIVGDKDNDQIKIISSDGKLLKVVGSGQGGLGPGEFRTPEGVEIRGETVWLSDSGNDRVVKYKFSKE